MDLNLPCYLVVLCALVTGCASVQRGTRLLGDDYPRREGPIVAQVSTSQWGGLRVLFNGRTSGLEDEQMGWIAGTPAEIVALFEKAGVRVAPPEVDFSQYVVVGVAGEDSWCTSEITSMTIDARGVVELRYEKPTTCPATGQCSCPEAGVRHAEVVAVPRRWLGRHLVFEGKRAAFRFDVPGPGPTLQRPVAPASPGDFSHGELVELPPQGHMTLRTLRNHSEVWVTHDSDGSVSVFSPSYISNEQPYLGIALRFGALGRFWEGYDAHGRYVHGVPFGGSEGRPLQGYPSKRLDDTHVLVGEPAQILAGPIQPRDQAPILDGPNRAYTQLPLGSSWDALADGTVGLLDLDVVATRSSGVRLCKLPLQSGTRPVGCPENAPFVAEYPRKLQLLQIVIDKGPIVVLRQGKLAKILDTPP